MEAVTIRGSETLPWFGRKPPITGNLIYTADGQMSVQIAGAPRGTILRDDFIKLSAAERAAWFDEYYAYYGTFELDEVAGIVMHHIVGSLLPYETATTLKRNVSIDKDALSLLTPPRDVGGGRTTFNRLIWKKIM